MELEQLFCAIDDFCLDFEAKLNSELISSQSQKRKRKSRLCLSEVMTIIVHFHQSSSKRISLCFLWRNKNSFDLLLNFLRLLYTNTFSVKKTHQY